MLETAKFEARLRMQRAAAVAAVVSGLVGLIVGMYPSIRDSEGFESYIEELPEALTSAMGGAVDVSTLEGFLVVEIYRTTWMMILGAYFAYFSASLIAGEIDRGSIEMTLMNPIRRRQLLLEKYLSTFADAVVVGAAGFLSVAGFGWYVGESVDLLDLALVNAGGTLYLVTCVAFGVLVSTFVDAEQRAQIAAFGGVALMYVVEAVVRGTDYEWLSLPMMSRYYDPNAILIEGELPVDELLVLALMSVAMVWMAAVKFERTDVA